MTTQACSACQRDLPLTDEFFRKKYGGKSWAKKCRECERDAQADDPDRYYRKTYGLSRAQLKKMEREQGGVCLLCGDDGPLVVDHKHGVGTVRGLLCRRCNMAVSFIEETPRLTRKWINHVVKYKDG